MNKQNEELRNSGDLKPFDRRSGSTDPVLSEKELNHIILALSMEIRDEYPELSRFLGEIPITVPVEDIPELQLENLVDYYSSLKSLKDNYGLIH